MEQKPVFANGIASCPVLNRVISRCFPRNFWTNAAKLRRAARFPTANVSEPSWRCYWTNSRRSPTWRPVAQWDCTPTRCDCGGGVGRPANFRWRIERDAGASRLFPPRDQALVKAIACEAVSALGLPLSRLSLADLAGQARSALGQPISSSSVWRILQSDAIKPWRYEHWIFPRDPQFAEKAGRVLDLYAGLWDGKALGPKDCIISSDEKTSIQARLRCHPTLPTGPGRPMRVEHEYKRGGALQYLAGWDVRRGRVMGRCESTTGIEPFGRLVDQVMRTEPYRSAGRVFWVVDNGSSHRGQAAINRLKKAYRKAILVHTPVHASWLNQVEIYFSIIQRKVLTPNDFPSLAAVEQRLRLYEELTNQEPRPFDWRFNRQALMDFLKRLEARQSSLRQAA